MKKQTPQRVAVIDLGSNTARMIVLQSIPGYSFRLVDEIREVVRLRAGMTDRRLNDQSIARAFSTLRLFKRFCDSTEVDQIIATATSAVREASNGRAFIERVSNEIGLNLQILSGDREAYFGVLGVQNEIPLDNGYVVDIGGGSAQISEVQDGKFAAGQALPIGALALTERFALSDPPNEKETGKVVAEIERSLATLDWLHKKKGRPLIGVGGTIRNLAKIEAARQKYPLYTLHGFTLEKASIEESIDLFRSTSLVEREQIPGLNPDRADIIFAGALVIREVMNRLEKDSLVISMSGIREGLFLEHFWQHLPYPVIPDVRRFSVLNLARNYQYNKAHANHVRYLCGRVFDQLRPLHGYAGFERELLDAAAILHDIGTIIGYDGHHKHSQALIETNGLPGYQPREIVLLALLARYHRKGNPATGVYDMLMEESDPLRLIRLSAVLRLAEYLERGRTSTIDDVILTWDSDELRITLIADEYPHVELWQAERNALPLLEQAFGKNVRLESVTAPAQNP